MNLTPTATARWVQEQEHILFPGTPPDEWNHRGCRVCGPGPLGRGEVPSAFLHVFYRVRLTSGKDCYGYTWTKEEQVPSTPEDATVVSSQIEGTNLHSVLLDIDLPGRMIESSTPGHHHLYIDKQLTWRTYRRLLKALLRAGLIEPGFYKASTRRKATHLRPPWIEKDSS